MPSDNVFRALVPYPAALVPLAEARREAETLLPDLLRRQRARPVGAMHCVQVTWARLRHNRFIPLPDDWTEWEWIHTEAGFLLFACVARPEES